MLISGIAMKSMIDLATGRPLDRRRILDEDAYLINRKSRPAR
jgi:hypothetical protein